MWLLNTHTYTLRNFVADIPDYVILSHTWEQEEVTFDDIGKPDQCTKLKGYTKILGCCRQAVQDGFEWAWIDTCCIDKRSSAELSEAINSMYKWYWNAAICYAYLQDVTDQQLALGTSKWFTRGWTLQELLAPSTVEFYTQSWSFIGTKAGLLGILHVVTGIDERFLEDRQNIQLTNVANKFSWASRRETSREEDIAYCLLGLVGINMPMLYGEGRRAFHRLQLEILRKTNDHTIFAWDLPKFHRPRPKGILAPTPSCFANSAGISNILRPTENLTHEVTNNGLRIILPIIEKHNKDIIALLHCKNKYGSRLGIRLRSSEDEKQQYGRSSLFNQGILVQCGEKYDSISTLYLVLDSETNHDMLELAAATRKDALVRIEDVRGNCGYKITSVVLKTGTAIEYIDANKCLTFNPRYYLGCIDIGTTARNPARIEVLFGFSSGGHPVFYTTGSDLDIQQTFKRGRSAALFDSLPHQQTGAGIDSLRVVLYGRGERTLMVIKTKKRLQSQRQIWVFSIQIIKCICSPGMYLDNTSPICTCMVLPFQEGEPQELSNKDSHG